MEDNRYDIQDNNNEEYNDNLSFADENYIFNNKTSIPPNTNYNNNYYNNYIPVTPKKKINKNYYSYNNNQDYPTMKKLNHNIKNPNNVKLSQDISPKYLSDIKNNIHHNYSLLYNGYTTEEGDSYNRNSKFNSQRSIQRTFALYPEDNNINTDDTNAEQLIIYPNTKKYKNKKEKYFDPEKKEGILENKNCEIYSINCIEYFPSDNKYKYKPITLGDYILKKPKKKRKTKSCENINTDNEEYKVRVFNKLNEPKKSHIKTNSCEHIYNISIIKDRINNKKKNKKIKNIANNNNKRKKKISKVLQNFSKDEINIFNNYISPEINDEKGGSVYFNQGNHTHRYNTNYRINKQNYKYVKYPNWKIWASACLIQSWWRSLKILYKKYLNKIIIIQKVYKMHYKKKYLIKEETINLHKKTIGYKTKNNIKFIPKKMYLMDSNNYIKNNKDKKNKNKEYNNTKYRKKYIYNKPNIKTINGIERESYPQKREFSFSSKNSYNHKFNIGILLLKKIIENNLIKIYKDLIYKMNNNNNYNNNSNSKNNLIYNNNRKINKLVFKNNEKDQLIFYEDNLKSSDNYTSRTNYLVHFDLITADNNIAFTYKGYKNVKNNNNPILKSVENINSFSIIKDNNNNRSDNKVKLNENNLSINHNNNSLKDEKIKNIKKNYNYVKKENNIKNLDNNINGNNEDKDKDLKNGNKKIQLPKVLLNAKDKGNNNINKEKNKQMKPIIKNKHILLNNIMKYVFDNIKKEVKRRKLIICFKIINTMKYPNLRYAFKKIKKFAKVRYKVMNEYASIIQNTFRFYLENKLKEEKLKEQTNINNQKLKEGKK